VKIIKRGWVDDDAPRRVTCHRCKSELEYTLADTAWQPGYEPQDESVRYLTCPVCAARVEVP
jgi:hypothetical protein